MPQEPLPVLSEVNGGPTPALDLTSFRPVGIQGFGDAGSSFRKNKLRAIAAGLFFALIPTTQALAQDGCSNPGAGSDAADSGEAGDASEAADCGCDKEEESGLTDPSTGTSASDCTYSDLADTSPSDTTPGDPGTGDPGGGGGDPGGGGGDSGGGGGGDYYGYEEELV